MLLYEPQQYIAEWAGRQLGVKDFGPCAAIGVLRNRELVGAAVFNHFEWPNIEITFCTSDKRWATPDVVRGIIRYPFLQLGCKRITAVTDDTNQLAIAFLCRMGFRQEGFHPDASPTGARVSYGLLRKDAEKWLTEDRIVGKQGQFASASA